MKISKLFHWLYAFLMVLPFLALGFNFIRFGLSGSNTLTSYKDVIGLITFPNFGSVSQTIYNAYYYLIYNVFGFSSDSTLIRGTIVSSLTYWTVISIVYLIFDVFMYVPLLVHRWLDKGVVE